MIDDTYERLLDSLPDINEKSLDDRLLATYRAAVDGHFLLADDADELLDYSIKRNVQKYSSDALGLTIAPTLMCNFRCVYCYETSKPGIISQETQDNVVKFVSSRIENLKDFDVTWYGGEPLLAVDAIASLSERFQKICSDHNVSYSAFMISNGSLIDQNIVALMKKHSIQGIQITIDGPPEVHDSRRISKNGKSSFLSIIDHINLLLSNGIEVFIRINVDKTNEETLDRLIAYLASHLLNQSVKISFGQVTAYTEACRSIESSCFHNEEFAGRLAKYYEILQNHGFQKANPFPYPSARLNYCCAELMNSFVLDHEGYLYKCWNLVGDVSRAIGNINDSSFDTASDKNAFWVVRDPLLNPQCKECSILPLCVGGCPYNRLLQPSSSNCDLIRYNIEDVMLTYYRYAKEGLL